MVDSILTAIVALSAAIAVFLVQTTTGLLYRWSESVSPISEDRAGDWAKIIDEFDMRPVRFLVTKKVEKPTAGAVGAAPFGRSVVVSEALLNTLSEDEQQAVIAHELAHHSGRHQLRRALLSSVAMAALLVFVLRPSVGAAFAVLACFLLLSVELVRQEYAADSAASEIIDETAFASGLRIVANANDGTAEYGRLVALAHMRPSIPARLRRLGEQNQR